MIVLGNNYAFNENQIIRIVRLYEGLDNLSIQFNNNGYLIIRNKKLADELFHRLTTPYTYMWRELKEYVWGDDFMWI